MNARPPRHTRRAGWWWLMGWLLFMARFVAAATAGPEATAGRLWQRIETVESGTNRPALPPETHSVSNLAWFSRADQPAATFVAPGPFVVRWQGVLAVELRTEVTLQAEVGGGAFALEINGAPVLTQPASRLLTRTEWSTPVRLRKGTNLLTARLTVSAETLDADHRLSLAWKGRGIPEGPIPARFWVATPAPDSAEAPIAETLLAGRALFLRDRCARCHALPKHPATPPPEVAADAPSFVGLGSRRQVAWMAQWIADPQALRPTATMPRLLKGPNATNDALAVAAWLGTLRGEESPEPAGNPGVGRELFESLQCRSCHQLATEPITADLVPLASVRAKFSPGALAEYLRNPQQHYAWNPMPRFAFATPNEVGHLAAYLRDAAPEVRSTPPPATTDTPTTLARGRELAATLGCLNCHAAPPDVENRQRALPWQDLRPERWNQGCLADTPPDRAPHYTWTPAERAALRSLGGAPAGWTERWTPTETAARWQGQLRCQACHEGHEGVPSLEYAGEKLRPDWTARLLRGDVAYRPRPWLRARMPAFPAYAETLAEGLAAQHGVSARESTSPETPPDADAAAVGRQLVSASKGFSCVSCHAIGAFGASAVFEAPGINLVHAADRLRPAYFTRWVRNPQWLDPATKMPLYFDEDGNSALADVYGGDGPKTLGALWGYLQQGEKLTPPAP